MWCIPTLTPEYIERMEDVLDCYAKPYNPKERVLCFDEKSKELHGETRAGKRTAPGKPRRADYEYRRNGTANIFLTVEPKGGYRRVRVTDRRTKRDFAKEIRRILSLSRYRDCRIIHIVLDNLNTHFESSFRETFDDDVTNQLLKRIRFHYTPKHASWLNMAEIEIGVMSTQAVKGRMSTVHVLRKQVAAWQRRRNRNRATIAWTFTKKVARKKLKYSRQN